MPLASGRQARSASEHHPRLCRSRSPLAHERGGNAGLEEIHARYRPSDKEIPAETLTKIKITEEDFSEAFREIQPSALREILIEIPDTTWNDVGGLEELARN